MKKKIVVLVLLMTMLAGPMFAADLEWLGTLSYVTYGLSGASLGLALVCYEANPQGNPDLPIGFLTAGGIGVGAASVMLLIYLLGDDKFAQVPKKGPSLANLDFGTNGQQTYVGVHFSY